MKIPLYGKGGEILGYLGYIPLASSFHEFKSPALAEAYQDSDLTPVGAGYLQELAGLKDQLLTDGIKIHVPRLAPNKSGYYYLNKLSRGVRKAFIKNTIRENTNLTPLTAILRADYADMEDFIAFPFVWTDTPQGYEYWNIVSTEARWNSNQNLKS